MTARQVIKILKKNGWVLDRISGSHHIFKKPGKSRSVAVPVHGNDDMGMFAKILLKEADIDPETKKEVEK
ncbi:MAG: type II toxin-antitoxin system HicA family toxin [Treponema sp.]|nr:type II toxin-antitoxin system HicA family toxin [Treponema sp.]